MMPTYTSRDLTPKYLNFCSFRDKTFRGLTPVKWCTMHPSVRRLHVFLGEKKGVQIIIMQWLLRFMIPEMLRWEQQLAKQICICSMLPYFNSQWQWQTTIKIFWQEASSILLRWPVKQCDKLLDGRQSSCIVALPVRGQVVVPSCFGGPPLWVSNYRWPSLN